jgi:hypothetical protein
MKTMKAPAIPAAARNGPSRAARLRAGLGSVQKTGLRRAGWLRRHSPLTLPGVALLAVSLFLLGRSFLTGSPYELVLALFGLGALLLLALGGRWRAFRLSRLDFEWDSSRPAVAGVDACEQRLRAPAFRAGIFYRLHFRVSGRLAVGRRAGMIVSAEAASAGGGETPRDGIPLGFFFPLCGEYQARPDLAVRDIFGLTRAGLGRKEDERVLVVQPAPFAQGRTWLVEAVGGFEDKSLRKSSDEERYYMREYMPGDRFRDINWKASSRLSQMVTRISPFTQEKTKVIPILLRHFRAPGPETVESLVHLNVLKGWLLAFLRQVKQEHPEYHFMVWTGQGREQLESEEDIERFAYTLGALFFLPDPMDMPAEPGWEEVYIFSTPYDRNLPTLLAQLPPSVPRVFRTRAARKDDAEPWKYSLFVSLESLSLPGAWIFRRDRRLAAPATGLPAGERLSELPLEVEVISV